MNDMIDITIDIAYFDAREARSGVPAQVMLEEHGLTLVSPAESGVAMLWHGERRGQGHYVLTGPEAGTDASLHRFADSTILEGFWRNGQGDRGFWRLHLPVDMVIPQETGVAKSTARAKVAKPRAKAPPRKRVRRVA